ncbi:MAG: glycosyltransferase family 39 protein [Planctomycetota bacterium]
MEAAAPRRLLFLVFLGALLFFLAGTWTHSLFDSDEPRFAEASRDMLARGDLLLPMLNGEPRLDKPVLVYWGQMIGYSLFGVGETGARFPSALGLALAVMLTVRMATRMSGLRAGLLAGLVLATSLQAGVSGRASTADGLLLGCVMLALDALHRRVRGERTFATWLAFWVAFGLCGLAKGPPGQVVPIVAGIGAFRLLRPEERGRALAGATAGFFLATAIVLAWAIPVDLRTDGGIFRVALGEHVLSRAGGGVSGHGGWAPWWFLYYVVSVPISFFPWSAWLPNAWRRWRDTGIDPRDRTFLAWWIAGTLLVFTAVIGKRPHYVLPALPALAMLVGGAISAGRGRPSRAGTWLVTAMFAAATLGFAYVSTKPGFPDLRHGGIVLLLALVVPLLRMVGPRRSARTAVPAAVLVSATLFAVLLFWVLPALERHRLVPRAAAALAEAAPPGTRRVVMDFRPDGLVYDSQRDADGRRTTETTVPLEHVTRGKPLLELLRSGKPVAVVMTEERHDRILEAQGLDRLPATLAWEGTGFFAKKSEWETVRIYVAPER